MPLPHLSPLVHSSYCPQMYPPKRPVGPSCTLPAESALGVVYSGGIAPVPVCVVCYLWMMRKGQIGSVSIIHDRLTISTAGPSPLLVWEVLLHRVKSKLLSACARPFMVSHRPLPQLPGLPPLPSKCPSCSHVTPYQALESSGLCSCFLSPSSLQC